MRLQSLCNNGMYRKSLDQSSIHGCINCKGTSDLLDRILTIAKPNQG
jgi:hypothetical protein